jgi:hypothetical protein
MLNDLYTFLERVPWPVLLIFALVLLVVGIAGNVRGWWYSKAAVEKLLAATDQTISNCERDVEELKKARDMWQQLTFESLQNNKKAVGNQALIAEAIRSAIGTKGETSHE